MLGYTVKIQMVARTERGVEGTGEKVEGIKMYTLPDIKIVTGMKSPA